MKVLGLDKPQIVDVEAPCVTEHVETIARSLRAAEGQFHGGGLKKDSFRAPCAHRWFDPAK